MAIACRPATPPPMIKARAGVRVPRGGRHHGDEARRLRGGQQHGFVAGHHRHRRQHVHGLRAGDARHEFQREAGGAGGGDAARSLRAGQRLEHGDERVAAAEAAEIRRGAGGERAHRKDDIGLREDLGRGGQDGRALLHVLRVREPGCEARRGFDDDRQAHLQEGGHDGRDHRHPALSGERFLEDSCFHVARMLSDSRRAAETGTPGSTGRVWNE